VIPPALESARANDPEVMSPSPGVLTINIAGALNGRLDGKSVIPAFDRSSRGKRIIRR